METGFDGDDGKAKTRTKTILHYEVDCDNFPRTHGRFLHMFLNYQFGVNLFKKSQWNLLVFLKSKKLGNLQFLQLSLPVSITKWMKGIYNNKDGEPLEVTLG